MKKVKSIVSVAVVAVLYFCVIVFDFPLTAIGYLVQEVVRGSWLGHFVLILLSPFYPPWLI